MSRPDLKIFFLTLKIDLFHTWQKKKKDLKNHNSAKNGFKRLGFLVRLANYAQNEIMGVKKLRVNFAGHKN